MSADDATTIRRLPTHLANQIAAGEVVQRPDSVVKELVENAIDAGADAIEVHITASGKTLIQVIDNGQGMTTADARLAFERHATSKISSLDDLERITTFGFRGEALPSIASVAQVELRTRTADSELAVQLRIAGGMLEEETKTQAPVGTSIAVKNLFFNTPARRQFLKSDLTEYRHIADTMQRFLLSSPQVGFLFTSDGEIVFDAPPGGFTDRLRVVFGDRMAGSLIAVEENTDLLSITGCVSRPSFAKKTRGDQYLFVNGRYVISRLLNHAIVTAYDLLLQQSEYPVYVLFLNIDPHAVDVNVHPAKLEVKFSNERNLYTMLNAVVRRNLFQADLSPSIGFRDQPVGQSGAERTAFLPPE
jgi:DNA mismatch repair protein MutL